MREIKFRAWIPMRVDEDDKEVFGMCHDLAFEEYAPINDLLAGVKHLMQYTGLKDKNGKEIYEGDIVKAVWEKEGFSVEIPYIYQIFYGSNGWADEESRIEVIGNIHENPELVKQ